MTKLLNIKGDFPILREPRGDEGVFLTYLDSGASSQKPEAVIKAEEQFYCASNANIHRGAYRLARKATEMYEAARVTVAAFIGAGDPRSLVFTSGTTMGTNIVAHAWAEGNLQDGDIVLFTEMEHHANIVPWHLLGKRRDIKTAAVKVDDRGVLDMEDLKAKLTAGEGQVKLVAVTHVSNVTGVKNPVKEITSLAHQFGVAVLVDGAQSAPHLPVDVEDIGCDFFVFSGHKMLGPTGIGGLYVRPSRWSEISPFFGGGDMITDVTLENSAFKPMPSLLEAGTPNIAGAVTLAAACDYLKSIGMERVEEHVRTVGTYAWNKLKAIPGVKVYGPGPGEHRTGSLVSFTVDGVKNDEIMAELDEYGVAVRVGRFCAWPIFKRLGLGNNGAVRASFHIYNNYQDVDLLASVIRGLAEQAHQ
ncbi:MAG: hypothetical protein A2294_03770 [Candidatus Magasanikbacteria bacterium RIFOXYB2_FULL_38_10]|nr:MAG: hypothetical protein A2294_03770 [Candidatus Magasanikbacteria bacterium RIFOXYB2_FULL_38_10]